MAYGETLNPNRRAATLAAVTAIHLALGYALVTGLGATILKKIDHNPVGVNIDLPPPPPPTPTPSAAASHNPLDPVPMPSPSLSFAPSDPAFTPLPPSPFASDGGVGDALFPTGDPPKPLPSFTPVAPRPLGNPGLWVTSDDYPTSDLRLGHAGVTRVALSIGLSGRVESCAVTGSSGFASLDAAACARIAQRARFKPATDAAGAPSAGRYATSVRWEIPE